MRVGERCLLGWGFPEGRLCEAESGGRNARSFCCVPSKSHLEVEVGECSQLRLSRLSSARALRLSRVEDIRRPLKRLQITG